MPPRLAAPPPNFNQSKWLKKSATRLNSFRRNLFPFLSHSDHRPTDLGFVERSRFPGAHVVFYDNLPRPRLLLIFLPPGAFCPFHPGELRRRVPTGRRLLLTGPFHAAAAPSRPPLRVVNPLVVVRHPKLETAARANFVRTAAGFSARRFGQVGKTANRAHVFHLEFQVLRFIGCPG